MGTYTTNKNLFMPSIGEQGWGELVNDNFSTIDTFLKPISLSGSTYTFTGSHVGNQSGGSIDATSISNSGTLIQTGTSTFTGKITGNGGIGTTSLTTSSTITSTGQIVANGGIAGNLMGNVTGNVQGLLFVKGNVQTSGDVSYATCPAQSITVTSTSSSSPQSITPNNYSISFGNPQKHGVGVYTRRSDLTGITNPSLSTRTLNVNIYALKAFSGMIATIFVYYKKSTDSSWTKLDVKFDNVTASAGAFMRTVLTLNVPIGTTYQFYGGATAYGSSVTAKAEIAAGTTYYVKYITP